MDIYPPVASTCPLLFWDANAGLVEALDDALLVGVHSGVQSTWTAFTESEDTLNDTQLGRRGVHARHGQPVVDNHARADDGTAAIDAARHERHLQQGTEFVLVLDARLRVHNAALVREGHVRARQDVSGDRLSKHLHAECVCDDFFRLSLQVRVDEGNVVVGGDHVAQRRKSLLDPLNLDSVRECIS